MAAVWLLHSATRTTPATLIHIMSYSPSIHYTQNDSHVYHVSEDPGIARFAPRPIRPDHPLEHHGPVVWAIGERLLHNYLLPRECPRVTYYAGPDTTQADRMRFFAMTGARYVIVIESRWLVRAMSARLICYSLPAESFKLVDETADYWISRTAIEPDSVRSVGSPLEEIAARAVELRVTPSLWPLHDAVLTSTLAFSFIRMANAVPRPQTSSAVGQRDVCPGNG